MTMAKTIKFEKFTDEQLKEVVMFLDGQVHDMAFEERWMIEENGDLALPPLIRGLIKHLEKK